MIELALWQVQVVEYYVWVVAESRDKAKELALAHINGDAEVAIEFSEQDVGGVWWITSDVVVEK